MDFYHDFLEEADIQKGDIVDVASDISSIKAFLEKKGVQFLPSKLLDALQEKVGDEGTLLVRTFNWDFCHGVPFHYRKTVGQTGLLGNIALRRPDFKRTRHPLYSWAVWGKDQEYLCSMNNKRSFGPETPWGYFETNNAKMLRLGDTKTTGFTFHHHIEQELCVPYRYEKTFSGTYIDELGNSSVREYSMFVRDLGKKIVNNEDEQYRRTRQTGVLHEWLYQGEVPAFTVSCPEIYRLIRNDLTSGLAENWVHVEDL